MECIDPFIPSSNKFYPSREQLEIEVMRKLQTYFNEAFNGMEEAFMNYSNMSSKILFTSTRNSLFFSEKVSSNQSFKNLDQMQIEQYISHNFLTIESAAGGLDSIQQIIIDHNNAMGSLASKYKKESKLLQENLNHVFFPPSIQLKLSR